MQVTPIIKKTREVEFDVCPHCQKEIQEKSTWVDENNYVYHNCCKEKGPIDKIKELSKEELEKALGGFLGPTLKFLDKSVKQYSNKNKEKIVKNKMEEKLAKSIAEGMQKLAKSPKGWGGTVEKMKEHKEIDNPFALAHAMDAKGAEPHYTEEGKKKKKFKKNKKSSYDFVILKVANNQTTLELPKEG